MPKDNLIERLREDLAKVGSLPISPSWMYMSIRHCQRNEDFEEYMDDELNVPDRQCGSAIANIVNALPDLLDELTRKQALIEAVSDILEDPAKDYETRIKEAKRELASVITKATEGDRD